MGGRINTVMQTCFFAVSGILPRDEAIASIKHAIEKTYGKRGESVVSKNFEAVDTALLHLHEVPVPALVTGSLAMRPPVPDEAPSFVKEVIAPIIAGRGDDLPVSAFPSDGTYPTGTSVWEKRGIALHIPVWDPETCIQCGRCVFVCPHAVIRAKAYLPTHLAGAPPSFRSAPAKWKELEGYRFTVQPSPDDCTGCARCVEACPARNKSSAGRKAINMTAREPVRSVEIECWSHFISLPEIDKTLLKMGTVKDIQLLRPLFEFSGCCAGCGETPYIKLLSQLFGERAVVANATGCSSIYGGNLPTTPWTFSAEGRGPAWSNSLFEDNAEFGLGFRLSLDEQVHHASRLLESIADAVGEDLCASILQADQSTEEGIRAQRARVAVLKEKLRGSRGAEARHLMEIADLLVRRSVWIIGGDGWAYDIGYGGLDHVLASGRNVNILVLDSEVYSNTGGQMSKATPLGAVAKFAAGGKSRPKKDLALMAMIYGNVYVARVAMGAKENQCVRAFIEAEAFDGPSLIIAYSTCIAHGFEMSKGMEQERAAVASGHWLLMRYNPDLLREGRNPLQLDSDAPSLPLEEYVYRETRYNILLNSKKSESLELIGRAKKEIELRWEIYRQLASMQVPSSRREVVKDA
jgi:pyruvate-ferredoxin/flavodoxin oxidoreductase